MLLLQVTLVQRNANTSSRVPTDADTPEEAASAAALEAAAFFPVSDPQFCTTKDGAAVKCSM